MNNVKLPNSLKQIAKIFKGSGYSVFLVGGAVRDILRGIKPLDWDLATDAKPNQVMQMFRRVIPTGIKHGTVTVLFDNFSFEITTFRIEAGYSDGRHPDSITYTKDIEADLARRDFTVNAIALNILTKQIIDPFGGLADIKARVLRCVGDPSERFSEDGLRPLRAARLAATLEFSVEQATQKAIQLSAEKVTKVAAERIGEEVLKLLQAAQPSRGLRVMEDTDLLRLILPELSACRGIEQAGNHLFDVLDHSYLACDYSPANNIDVRLAALLHDIGKPLACRVGANGLVVFHRHEDYSAELANTILTRLKYSKRLIGNVCHLIRMHMFNYDPSWSDAAIRRFIIRVGTEHLSDLFSLRLADSYALQGRELGFDPLIELKDRITEALQKDQVPKLSNLTVTGHDLIGLGVKKGPKIGLILRELLETVIDDPTTNNREKLLEIAANIAARYS